MNVIDPWRFRKPLFLFTSLWQSPDPASQSVRSGSCTALPDIDGTSCHSWLMHIKTLRRDVWITHCRSACVCVFPACWRETAVTSCHVSKAVMDNPGLFLHFPCQRVPHCLLVSNQFNTEPAHESPFELVISFEFVIDCNQCQYGDC